MKEIKAIFCDMDGTAVQYDNEPFHSSWDALLDILSEQEKEEWILTRDHFCQRKEGYDEWFKQQVRILKGKKLEDAKKALFPVPYSPGFVDFFSKNNSLKKAIVSSGISLVAEKIVEELGFDDYIAQSLEIEEGLFTGKGNYCFSNCKVGGIRNLAEKYDLDLKEVCYVGDSSWDISCLDVVGLPLAFNPKKCLIDHVKDKKIPIIKNFRDLKGYLN